MQRLFLPRKNIIALWRKNEMITKLFRYEMPDFRARQERQVKRCEPYWRYGEHLFTMSDEVVAENLALQ